MTFDGSVAVSVSLQNNSLASPDYMRRKLKDAIDQGEHLSWYWRLDIAITCDGHFLSWNRLCGCIAG